MPIIPGALQAEPDARRYFKAFDLDDSGVVDYREFLIGLISLDLATAHGGVLGEQRTLYIFRVFDEDGDGYLSLAEFESMIAAIRSARGQAAGSPEEAIRVQEVAEDEDDMVIFSKPGIREAMADPELLMSVCYTDASGQMVSHDIPTNQTFHFALSKKPRKSTIKAGVLQITG